MFRKRFHILLRENRIEVRNLDNGRQGSASAQFSHPRMLVGDFRAASRCLHEALRDAGGAGVALHHSALVQAMECIEGGICAVERATLSRLATVNRMSQALVLDSSRALSRQEALELLETRRMQLQHAG